MTDWAPLKQELSIWRDEGLELPFWWRDDDAVADTPALDRLSQMARDHGLRVHLAIIPAALNPSLISTVKARPELTAMVHGWAHENHAPATEKKAEFGVTRPLDARIAEAQRGFRILSDQFGDALQPVFVPPWNRIGADLFPHLATIGYRALSTYGPRRTALPAEGLTQVNTHIDPIDWRGTRSAIPGDQLCAHVVDLLCARREGTADNTEPLGLLTHHLVHDDAIWRTSEQFLDTLFTGPLRPISVLA